MVTSESAAEGRTKSPRKRQAGKSKERSSRTRASSKQVQLIEMLKRPEGATIQEIVAKLKWQAHTVRGAFAGALKKRLGLKVESEKVGERGRIYRLR